jgi:hypothetical protein
LTRSGHDEFAVVAPVIVNNNFDIVKEIGNALDLVKNDPVRIGPHKSLRICIKPVDRIRIIEGDISVFSAEEPLQQGGFSGLTGSGQSDNRKELQIFPDCSFDYTMVVRHRVYVILK